MSQTTYYNPSPSSGTAFRQYAVSDASSSFLSHRRLSNSSQMDIRSPASRYASSSALSGAATDCTTRYSPVSGIQSSFTANESQRGFWGGLLTWRIWCNRGANRQKDDSFATRERERQINWLKNSENDSDRCEEIWTKEEQRTKTLGYGAFGQKLPLAIFGVPKTLLVVGELLTWIFWCSKRGFRCGKVLRHLLEKQSYLEPPILSLTMSGNYCLSICFMAASFCTTVKLGSNLIYCSRLTGCSLPPPAFDAY